jgi:hypothetical protein
MLRSNVRVTRWISVWRAVSLPAWYRDDVYALHELFRVSLGSRPQIILRIRPHFGAGMPLVL